MTSGPIDNRRRAGRGARAPAASLDEVVQLAVGFLARCDRTVAQVQTFLAARGVSTPQIQHVLRRLIDLQYLSDQAYAQRWVERRLFMRPMGAERVKVELRAKGISDELVDQVVTGVFRTLKEETLARQALQAKQRCGRRLTPVQMERFLRQRGFEDETIEQVIRERQRKKERVHEE